MPTSTEDVESFRTRARLWLKENMPLAPGPRYAEEQLDSDGIRARELQRILFDGGFAGICFPVEYGGQGLSPAHQRAFTEESAPYEMPIAFNTPALTICAPTILDFGTMSKSAATCRPSSAATRSGCSSCPSPPADRTWLAW
jgi:alkylation response protein AidB-like acyl-CoA dehydrogenase